MCRVALYSHSCLAYIAIGVRDCQVRAMILEVNGDRMILISDCIVKRSVAFLILCVHISLALDQQPRNSFVSLHCCLDQCSGSCFAVLVVDVYSPVLALEKILDIVNVVVANFLQKQLLALLSTGDELHAVVLR